MNVKYKKAPGQRMIKRMSLRQKSWLNSLGGAFLFGIGQCLFALSWLRLYNGDHKPTWLFMIFLGLVIILAGLYVMGKALIFSSQIKARKYYKKRRNRFARQNQQNSGELQNQTLKIEKSPRR